jgi:hypothetical protein
MMKSYLGDAVYVDSDGYGLWLTTEDGGDTPSNRIYLEPEVYAALARYVERLRAPEDGSATVGDACGG